MAVVFDYAVLMAVPDAKRGERVNVGIIVFLPDRLDVRVSELSKLKALTGRDWEDYGRSLQRRLCSSFDAEVGTKRSLAENPRIDRVFQASSIASFSVPSPEKYDERVKQILTSLVARPKADEERVKGSRINTEITRSLRQYKILAKRDEQVESHKVFRNVPVEDGLKVDFFQTNGATRVTSTVDFRRPTPDVKEAALKSLVLDQAGRKYGQSVKRFGVYAARKIDEDAAKPYVHLLGVYATDIFNWESAEDRGRYLNLALTAASSVGTLV